MPMIVDTMMCRKCPRELLVARINAARPINHASTAPLFALEPSTAPSNLSRNGDAFGGSQADFPIFMAARGSNRAFGLQVQLCQARTATSCRNTLGMRLAVMKFSFAIL